MPALPCGSSAAPTLYQTIWVTTGARRSGITTTCMPLSRVKRVTSMLSARAGEAAVEAATAKAATATVSCFSRGGGQTAWRMSFSTETGLCSGPANLPRRGGPRHLIFPNAGAFPPLEEVASSRHWSLHTEPMFRIVP